jgi:hypothetical protein
LGLFGAAALPTSANLAFGKSGAAHRSQYGQSTTKFLQRENHLARTSRYQTEFSKGLRVAENRTIRFARQLQRLIVRSPPLRTPTLRRPTSIMFETDRVIFVRPALFAPVFVTP